MTSDLCFSVCRVRSAFVDEEIRRSLSKYFARWSKRTRWEGDSRLYRHVVVKPNWVQESHEDKPTQWEQVITHPSLVIAVVEEVASLLQGAGTITICDGPHTYADFEAIIAHGNLKNRLAEVAAKWPKLKLELLDLRREVWHRREGVVVDRQPNLDDPRGYVCARMNRHSHFFGFSGEGRYYGADYDCAVVNQHHRGETHEYLLSGTALKCDLFINLPKLKTHKKTGLTCCLKNLVGINGDKNWLPHHTEGHPWNGGDEFCRDTLSGGLERLLKRSLRNVALKLPGVGTWIYRKARKAGQNLLGGSEEVVRNGNWYGNDTCWRMVLDLNRAFFYSDESGNVSASFSPRAYLAIVDGIVGGEGNGPLCPDPVNSGVLIAGTDPVAIDAVAARLMGFRPEAIPLIREAFVPHPLPITQQTLESVRVMDERIGKEIPLSEVQPAGAPFRPHFGWAGHVESEPVVGGRRSA
jgi:uncharacterized protein (DUF362 family)